MKGEVEMGEDYVPELLEYHFAYLMGITWGRVRVERTVRRLLGEPSDRGWWPCLGGQEQREKCELSQCRTDAMWWWIMAPEDASA